MILLGGALLFIFEINLTSVCLLPRSGHSVSADAWAASEQMVVTIKPNLLTLKIRTWMCASGRPGFAKLAPIDDDSDDRSYSSGGVDDIEKYVTAALLASGMGSQLALLKE